MHLIYPPSLLGLTVVAATAAWALFRPGRQLAVVGSLSLWQQALDSLGRSARRSSRRVTASWVLLLAGGVAAVVALARPVLETRRPARRVALAVYPSAELGAADAPGGLADAAGALLDRLGPDDRVQLLRPALLGGAGQYVSPSAAREQLAGLELLPAPAAELVLPAPADASQRTYHLAPAGADVPRGARSTAIELPSRLPPVTVEAIGAVETGPGAAELFVALRSRQAGPWSGRLAVRALPLGGADGRWQVADAVPIAVEPGKRRELVRRVRPAAALAVTVESADGRQVAAAYLARLAPQRRSVAILGADEPFLRRFIEADETLELVGRAEEADVVFANRLPAGRRAPADKPALVIAASTDPPGWRRGPTVGGVSLADAQADTGDPVLRGVNLAGAAVRTLRPWVRTGRAGQKVLASYKGDAIILRSASADEGARRVFVAFELSGFNTDLAMSEAFVVFLANAVRWLAPPGRAEPSYAWASPAEAPCDAGWRRLAGRGPGGPAGPLPWPGVFRDAAGACQAVNLVGLADGRTTRPTREAVAAAPLPEPQPVGRRVELWALLAAAAVALWLAGWAVRVK